MYLDAPAHVRLFPFPNRFTRFPLQSLHLLHPSTHALSLTRNPSTTSLQSCASTTNPRTNTPHVQRTLPGYPPDQHIPPFCQHTLSATHISRSPQSCASTTPPCAPCQRRPHRKPGSIPPPTNTPALCHAPSPTAHTPSPRISLSFPICANHKKSFLF